MDEKTVAKMADLTVELRADKKDLSLVELMDTRLDVSKVSK